MKIDHPTVGMITGGVRFLSRQQHDWKITAIRASLDKFFYQMVLPYLSVYTMSLGATATQVGIVNSAGMAAAALLSPFTGWMIDRISLKKVYLVGVGLVAISYLLYGIAGSWFIIIIAMLTYQVGFTTGLQGCATVCGNSMVSADRATAMACCETFAAGLMGMLGPMVGAFVVTLAGGVNTSGIRPIYFIAFLV